MSLIKTKNKEATYTESEVNEILQEALRNSNKKAVKKFKEFHKANYQSEREKIDLMNIEELKKYIKKSESNSARVGLTSIKINSHELALFKLALKITGCDSMRDLFVRCSRYAIKNNAKLLK